MWFFLLSFLLFCFVLYYFSFTSFFTSLFFSFILLFFFTLLSSWIIISFLWFFSFLCRRKMLWLSNTNTMGRGCKRKSKCMLRASISVAICESHWRLTLGLIFLRCRLAVLLILLRWRLALGLLLLRWRLAVGLLLLLEYFSLKAGIWLVGTLVSVILHFFMLCAL